MKIIELITFLAPGGAERFVVDLSNQLAKNHDTYLITLLDDKKDQETRNFYRQDISDRVKYINLGLPNGRKLSSQWKVYTALRKIKPDVIHIHMIPTLKYSALASALFAITKNIYFSIHSDLHNGYDKGIIKKFCNTFGRLNRFKLSCLSNKNFQDFTAFYPHTTIKCIENGRAPIEPSRLFNTVKKEFQDIRSKHQTKVLLHIARCHPQKNQKLLIEAVNKLVSIGHNIDLIIIGAGYDSLEGEKLKKIACNRVHFIGTRHNASDYMLNADLFCLSSDFEGLPITLLEANLAGIPAVSTPVCGAVDIIQDGINGYLSPSHSLNDYTDTLVKALNDYENIKTNALRLKENSPYTIENCANKYIEYFKE